MPIPTTIDRNKFIACISTDEQRDHTEVVDRMFLAILLAHSQSALIPITERFVEQVRGILINSRYPDSRKAFEALLTGDA